MSPAEAGYHSSTPLSIAFKLVHLNAKNFFYQPRVLCYNFDMKRSTKESVLVSLVTTIVVLLFIAGIARMFPGFLPSILGSDSAISIRDNEPLPTVSTETRITEIVERANPAVVSVVARREEQAVRMFGPFEVLVPNGERQQVGGGSGFFISPDGLLMTNKHVVSDGEVTYSIVTSDGEEHAVSVLDTDPFNDLAILQVEGGGSFPYLEFGDSSELEPGQTVIAIGNALGEFFNSVSVGVVSGLSRSVVASGEFGRSELLDEVIQTDAAINRGNSGGPLLDINGKVVGVNVAVAIGSENIGFALPGNIARQASDSAREFGEIIRPYLGIRYVQVTERLVLEEDLPVDHGIYVVGGGSIAAPAVIPESPADRAGIREGDIIISIDGADLDDTRSLSSVIREKKVGEEVTMEVIRSGGERRTVTATLEKAPSSL